MKSNLTLFKFRQTCKMPPSTFGGIFASAPRVNARRKRFRSLVVDIIGHDVVGVCDGDLHHAPHPSHSAHPTHASHAAGHSSCTSFCLLGDLGDDTLQQRSIFIRGEDTLVLPPQCTIEKPRLQRL